MKHAHQLQQSNIEGFTIIHALISLFIFASITLATINWQRFTSNVDIGRNLGQQYLTINAAVNNYMVTYYQSLAALKPACSEMSFTTTNPASAPTTERANADCSITIAAGRTIANGLQPSPAELITLGLLPASPTVTSTNLLQIESPNLATTQIVYEYMPTQVPTRSGPSQPRLFINIEMVCLQRGSSNNPNNGTAIPTSPEAAGCPSATTTTALKSLIFNTQPYNNHLKSYSYTFPALLGSAFTTMGDDAVTSGITDVQLLNSGSALNGKNFQLTNPIIGGPSGIMGLRGGYGASYAMQHSRVDGTNPPTGDWDFGKHKVTADTIDATFRLKIAHRIVGEVCHPDLESVGIATNGDLLVCKNGSWSKQIASGTVDFSRRYEVGFGYGTNNGVDNKALWAKDCYTHPGSCTNIAPDTGIIPQKDCINNTTTNTCSLYVALPFNQFIPVVQQIKSFNPTSADPENKDSGFSFIVDGNSGNYRVEINYILAEYIRVFFYPIAQ